MNTQSSELAFYFKVKPLPMCALALLAFVSELAPRASEAPGILIPPSAVIVEHDGFLEFQIFRSAPVDFVQKVDYATHDASARAGRDYLGVQGTITFVPGESAAFVRVPILDTPTVDGERIFHFELNNPQPDAAILPWIPGGSPPVIGCDGRGVGVILDNEFPLSAVDPTFVPEYQGNISFLESMPDGRVLVNNRMLLQNGLVDSTFQPAFWPLHIFTDGRILGWRGPSGSSPRLARFLPTGALEAVLSFVDQDAKLETVQPDGKIVMSHRILLADSLYSVLFRLNSDGSPDKTFQGGTLNAISIEKVLNLPDGKLLIRGQFLDVSRGGLARLEPDGAVDTTFSHSFGYVVEVFARKSGKFIIKYRPLPESHFRIIQVNPDWTEDRSFTEEVDASATCVEWWSEQSDGSLIALTDSRIHRLNADGSLEKMLSVLPRVCWQEGGIPGRPHISITPTGDILFSGFFDEIDGVRRAGLVRLLGQSEPRPDFRVFAPPLASRSAGSINIRILRTGDTSLAASVDYSIAEIPELRGTLSFRPRESSRDFSVPIPMAPASSSDRGAVLMLELSNPSAGYRIAGPIPIVIRPDLKLIVSPVGGKITAIGLEPTWNYVLESKSNLDPFFSNYSWSGLGIFRSEGSLVLTNFDQSSPFRFFRLRRLP